MKIRSLAAVLVLLAAAGCTSSPTPTPLPSVAATTVAPAPFSVGGGALAVGATADLNDATIQVTKVARPMTVAYQDTWNAPKAGMEWVGVSARICIKSGSGYVSRQPWTITEPDGTAYPPSYVSDGLLPAPAYPTYAPFKAGECAAGIIPFQVPTASAGVVRYGLVANGAVQVVTWKP